jgi:hypothetical protein
MKRGNLWNRKEVTIQCLCNEINWVEMVGRNNADGKGKCACGRNITIHLRRDKKVVTNEDG